MRPRAAFVLLTAVISLAPFSRAQEERGPSTAAERIRAIVIAEHLEADPLNPAYAEDFEWLVDWVDDVPDITVKLCPANMPYKSNYKRAPLLTGVDLAASVTFIIQHPDKAKDPVAVGVAALESMIRAYQNILRKEHGARSKEMDAVIQLQQEGRLADYVSARWKTMCH